MMEAESGHENVPLAPSNGGDNDAATAEPVATIVAEQATPSATNASSKNFEDYSNVSQQEATKNDAVVPMSTPQPSSWLNSKRAVWGGVCTVIVVVIIVLAVVLTQGEAVEPQPQSPPPISVDFSTGVSLITSYAIETKVRSRLARTKITMKVANALDCSSIHAVSLQLPLDTRITSIKTITDDECTAEGEVQELKKARETFMESASKGIPGAYVEAQDSFTHSVQVAIPPLGISNVELVVEQLLQQRLDEVKFEIPLLPNEQVDSVVFDLTVEDTVGELIGFHIDLDVPDIYEAADEDSNSTDTSKMMRNTEGVHLDVPDARQHKLPKVIKGTYKPGKLPENGLLFTDGKCFEHYFHPSSLDPMPRNFVFVIDTSESMQYGSKLDHARSALSVFIDSLKPEDTFTIQSFGNKGTERLWGSGPGTPDEKEAAKKFLSYLSANSYKTNLHEAFLEALLRAKYDAENSDDNVATILVMLSDGYATRGETNRTKIAEHVWELNQEGTVKIFNLGFQGSADMQLLDAIALMNGGVSAPILEGQENFADQITTFLESEIGSILMSDVNVDYSTTSGGAKNVVFGETQKMFPVLADGYEVVVRGLIGKPGDVLAPNNDTTLNAVTSASTMDNQAGPWEVMAASENYDAVKSSLCYQSYAHDRITQLIRFHDASGFLGNDLVKRLVTLSKKDCLEEDFAKCIRAEALDLAVDANVVAKGLTAMVTTDNEKCMKADEDAEICLDGTTPGGTQSDDDYLYDKNAPVYSPQGYGHDGVVVESAAAHSYDSYGDGAAAGSSATQGYEYDEATEESAPAPAPHSYGDSVTTSSSGSYTYHEYSGAGAAGHDWVSGLVLFSGWLIVFVLGVSC